MRFTSTVLLSLSLSVLPAYAGVFTCEENGETVFRDHPCQSTVIEKPEKTPEQLEAELREAALKQQQLQSLIDSNNILKDKLEKLEKLRDVEIEYYQEKIALSSDKKDVQKHDFFERLKELKQDYSSQINPLEIQIKKNNEQIEALKAAMKNQAS